MILKKVRVDGWNFIRLSSNRAWGSPSHGFPSEIRFYQTHTLSLCLSVMGRVSPVPNYTFHTYRFLYTEGFFRAVFQFLHTFHGFRLFYQGSTSLFLFRVLFNDTAEFTLCYGLHDCSHLFQGYFIHSLSTLYYYNAPSLATLLSRILSDSEPYHIQSTKKEAWHKLF